MPSYVLQSSVQMDFAQQVGVAWRSAALVADDVSESTNREEGGGMYPISMDIPIGSCARNGFIRATPSLRLARGDGVRRSVSGDSCTSLLLSRECLAHAAAGKICGPGERGMQQSFVRAVLPEAAVLLQDAKRAKQKPRPAASRPNAADGCAKQSAASAGRAHARLHAFTLEQRLLLAKLERGHVLKAMEMAELQCMASAPSAAHATRDTEKISRPEERPPKHATEFTHTTALRHSQMHADLQDANLPDDNQLLSPTRRLTTGVPTASAYLDKSRPSTVAHVSSGTAASLTALSRSGRKLASASSPFAVLEPPSAPSVPSVPSAAATARGMSEAKDEAVARTTLLRGVRAAALRIAASHRVQDDACALVADFAAAAEQLFGCIVFDVWTYDARRGQFNLLPRANGGGDGASASDAGGGRDGSRNSKEESSSDTLTRRQAQEVCIEVPDAWEPIEALAASAPPVTSRYSDCRVGTSSSPLVWLPLSAERHREGRLLGALCVSLPVRHEKVKCGSDGSGDGGGARASGGDGQSGGGGGSGDGGGGGGGSDDGDGGDGGGSGGDGTGGGGGVGIGSGGSGGGGVCSSGRSSCGGTAVASKAVAYDVARLADSGNVDLTFSLSGSSRGADHGVVGSGRGICNGGDNGDSRDGGDNTPAAGSANDTARSSNGGCRSQEAERVVHAAPQGAGGGAAFIDDFDDDFSDGSGGTSRSASYHVGSEAGSSARTIAREGDGFAVGAAPRGLGQPGGGVRAGGRVDAGDDGDEDDTRFDGGCDGDDVDGIGDGDGAGAGGVVAVSDKKGDTDLHGVLGSEEGVEDGDHDGDDDDDDDDGVSGDETLDTVVGLGTVEALQALAQKLGTQLSALMARRDRYARWRASSQKSSCMSLEGTIAQLCDAAMASVPARSIALALLDSRAQLMTKWEPVANSAHSGGASQMVCVDVEPLNNGSTSSYSVRTGKSVNKAADLASLLCVPLSLPSPPSLAARHPSGAQAASTPSPNSRESSRWLSGGGVGIGGGGGGGGGGTNAVTAGVAAGSAHGACRPAAAFAAAASRARFGAVELRGARAAYAFNAKEERRLAAAVSRHAAALAHAQRLKQLRADCALSRRAFLRSLLVDFSEDTSTMLAGLTRQATELVSASSGVFWRTDLAANEMWVACKIDARGTANVSPELALRVARTGADAWEAASRPHCSEAVVEAIAVPVRLHSSDNVGDGDADCAVRTNEPSQVQPAEREMAELDPRLVGVIEVARKHHAKGVGAETAKSHLQTPSSTARKQALEWRQPEMSALSSLASTAGLGISFSRAQHSQRIPLEQVSSFVNHLELEEACARISAACCASSNATRCAVWEICGNVHRLGGLHLFDASEIRRLPERSASVRLVDGGPLGDTVAACIKSTVPVKLDGGLARSASFRLLQSALDAEYESDNGADASLVLLPCAAHGGAPKVLVAVGFRQAGGRFKGDEVARVAQLSSAIAVTIEQWACNLQQQQLKVTCSGLYSLMSGLISPPDDALVRIGEALAQRVPCEQLEIMLISSSSPPKISTAFKTADFRFATQTYEYIRKSAAVVNTVNGAMNKVQSGAETPDPSEVPYEVFSPRSVLLLPLASLSAGGAVLGLLQMVNREGGSACFGLEDVETATSFAALCALLLTFKRARAERNHLHRLEATAAMKPLSRARGAGLFASRVRAAVAKLATTTPPDEPSRTPSPRMRRRACSTDTSAPLPTSNRNAAAHASLNGAGRPRSPSMPQQDGDVSHCQHSLPTQHGDADASSPVRVPTWSPIKSRGVLPVAKAEGLPRLSRWKSTVA